VERILTLPSRVLLLTQWFDPEPTFKGLAFAKELVKQGFDIEVVTGFPNYPGGKIYQGYNLSFIKKECIDGVSITRVPLYPSHGKSVFGRTLNYISFSVSAILYCLFCKKKPSVVYAYHPPLTVGIAAVVIGFFRRAPVVYDIQDMWPDTLKATGMISSNIILKTISIVCSWVYRRVDQIVVLSPGFKKLLIERGVRENKIKLIYNWCDEKTLFSSINNLPDRYPEGKFVVLFAGNIGRAQALNSVLEAAELIQETGNQDIQFVFVGGGLEVNNLKNYSNELSLTNVTFLPKVPMSNVGTLLKNADVLLVHLSKNPLFTITIPSKVQAYLAVGKPILLGVRGDAADIVKESGCGEIAIPENPRSIADACILLYNKTDEQREMIGNKGAKFYREKLSMSSGVKAFGKIFLDLSNNKQKKP
jgi:glycosyltransferase involved in cell wall biosynthesis